MHPKVNTQINVTFVLHSRCRLPVLAIEHFGG